MKLINICFGIKNCHTNVHWSKFSYNFLKIHLWKIVFVFNEQSHTYLFLYFKKQKKQQPKNTLYYWYYTDFTFFNGV